MDCLRSFTFNINQTVNFATAGVNIKNWGVAGNYHWIVNLGQNSILNIQGFKKLDLYGIAIVGNVQTDAGLANAAIVQDYGFDIVTDGQIPLPSAVISGTNLWGINLNNQTFSLTKYLSKIEFESPITGLNNLTISRFFAQGNNGETLNSIDLGINVDFIFYYKYEGE
jgi:hypothetical protein